jgi:hypothetical protein
VAVASLPGPQGRLAQLGERLLDKQEVTGSSPVSPIVKAPLRRGFLVEWGRFADLYVLPMRFDEHLKTFFTEALERTPGEEAREVYVVSLFVDDEDDDPRYPTVTVGYNTEAQVGASLGDASDDGEARWNFAFWLQNELGVLGAADRDPEGARLREQWIRQADLWYSDDEEDDDFEATLAKGEAITSRFVELVVAVAQQLHADGTIERVFGRAIPVLVHELEYYDQIAEQNRRANPAGLADDFARWIAER